MTPLPSPVLRRSERTYEIHEVAELTGLAPARLRAWERRYEVVRPVRLPNGYRTYTGQQVALLSAYARLVAAGERIGDLVSRPVEDVLSRAEERTGEDPAHAAVLEAVRDYDRERLEALVAQQLSLRGFGAFASEVVIPLARDIGVLWALGRLPIGAEHLATEVVIPVLKAGLRSSRGPGPLFLAGCLPRERHEWGVLVTLAALQDQGWRVQYLGPDLPIEEIVEAARRLAARAVGVSASVPALVRGVLPELATLPGRLPKSAVAVAGGAGVEPFARQLRGYGFRIGIESLVRPAR